MSKSCFYFLSWLFIFSLPSSSNTIAAGLRFILALDTDGRVWSFGDGGKGQLGYPLADRTTCSDEPKIIEALPQNIVSVAAGAGHGLALSCDGDVWSFGTDLHGALGHGVEFLEGILPKQVAGLQNIQQISTFSTLSAALDSDGQVWVFGDGVFIPKLLEGFGDKIVSIAVGAMGKGELLAIDENARVWVWRAGDSVPKLKEGLSNIKEIAVGGIHCFALDNCGSLWGWGHQYASPSFMYTLNPELVLENINSISAGSVHCAALDGEGNALIWWQAAQSQCQLNCLRAVPELKKSNCISFSVLDDNCIWLDDDGNLRVQNFRFDQRPRMIPNLPRLKPFKNRLASACTFTH